MHGVLRTPYFGSLERIASPLRTLAKLFAIDAEGQPTGAFCFVTRPVLIHFLCYYANIYSVICTIYSNNTPYIQIYLTTESFNTQYYSVKTSFVREDYSNYRFCHL